tara:strand:+ start:266 stop:637 length:372 start_codon:yes stop_codon:yes gene_type:complete
MDVIKNKTDKKLVIGNWKKTDEVRTIQRNVDLVDVEGITSATFKFKVVERSRCRVSYNPTEIFINAKQVGTIDFRPLKVGDTVTKKFVIKTNVLKKGGNNFKIIAGICDLNFDSLAIHNLSIQ